MGALIFLIVSASLNNHEFHVATRRSFCEAWEMWKFRFASFFEHIFKWLRLSDKMVFIFAKRFSKFFLKSMETALMWFRSVKCAVRILWTRNVHHSVVQRRAIYFHQASHFPLQNNAVTDIAMEAFISKLQSWAKPLFDNNEKLQNIRGNRAWYHEMIRRRFFISGTNWIKLGEWGKLFLENLNMNYKKNIEKVLWKKVLWKKSTKW